MKYLAGVAAGLTLGAATSLAVAQDPDPQAAGVALGREIAAAAAAAELPAGDAAAARVRNAVQGVIIAAGAEPAVVLIAMDSALTACRSVDERPAPAWVCPGTPGAYMALASLRRVVLAQIEQVDPAAENTPGTAAFGSFAPTAPSANYSRPG